MVKNEFSISFFTVENEFSISFFYITSLFWKADSVCKSDLCLAPPRFFFIGRLCLQVRPLSGAITTPWYSTYLLSICNLWINFHRTLKAPGLGLSLCQIHLLAIFTLLGVCFSFPPNFSWHLYYLYPGKEDQGIELIQLKR